MRKLDKYNQKENREGSIVCVSTVQKYHVDSRMGMEKVENPD